MISCDMDSHSVYDCLKDNNCPNYETTIFRFDNWDKLNYNYKLKKQYQGTMNVKAVAKCQINRS